MSILLVVAAKGCYHVGEHFCAARHSCTLVGASLGPKIPFRNFCLAIEREVVVPLAYEKTW